MAVAGEGSLGVGVDVAPGPPAGVGPVVGPAVVVGMDVAPEPPRMVGSRAEPVVGDAAGSDPQATSMKSVVANSVSNFNTLMVITTSSSFFRIRPQKSSRETLFVANRQSPYQSTPTATAVL